MRSSGAGVFAVVPAYRRATVTEAAVRSLARVADLGGCIVVEHGGQDETAARATRAWHRCEVVRASKDLWWTGAVNVGVSRALAAGATHVLIVNDDESFDAEFLRFLMAEHARTPNAIVGAKILDASSPRTIVSYGASIDFGTAHVRLDSAGAVDDGRFDHTSATTWLPYGMLVPANVWRRLGRLEDGLLPHYFGDVHLSFRAREVGARVLVCGRSRIFVDPRSTGILRHDVPLTIGRGIRSFVSRRSWANVRDHALFAWRHGPNGCLLRYLFAHCIRHGRLVVRQALLRGVAFSKAERILLSARQKGKSPTALYASGWESQWLLEERPAVRRLVDFLIDDRRAGEAHPSGLDVVTQDEAARRGVRTVVVNCAAHEETMFAKLAPLRANGIAVHRLYGILPPPSEL